MGTTTAIGWTDHTFNPWWGCERVSPGCQHCYAEAFAKRTGNAVWGKNADRRFFGEKHWREPLRWNAAAVAEGRPHLVFCASMADVFEDRPDLVDERARLFELIAATPALRWQLLTKRPENVPAMVPRSWLDVEILTASDGMTTVEVDRLYHWPWHVWIGTTVEDQQRADERIPRLLEIPAAVHFLSCEPLLGPVDLDRWLLGDDGFYRARPLIQWAIVGGESGPGHRPMNLDHARSLVAQLEQATIPVFFKQVGGRTPTAGGDQLDGRTIKQLPK